MSGSKHAGNPSRSLASGLFAGVLFAASYGVEGWWPIGLVAFVPWLIRTHSPVQRAVGGLTAGFVCSLWIGLWVPGALRIAGSEVGASVLALVVLAGVAALPLGLVGLLSALLTRRLGLALGCGLAAMTIDVARTYVPFAQPWGVIGHTQLSNTGVLQLAVMGGTPLLSALVFACNGVVVDFLRGGPADGRAGSIAAGCLLAVGGLSLAGEPLALRTHPTSSESSSVLVMQPDLRREARWARSAQRTNLRALEARTRLALGSAGSPPDLVVWPEMVVTTPLEQDPALASQLLGVATELGVPLIAGFARAPEGEPAGRYRNAAGWFDPEGRLVSVVDKEIAVPLIESSARFPGARLLGGLLDESAWGLARVSQVSEDGRLIGGNTFALALCYEIQFSRLIARRMEAGAFGIVNLSNEGWIESERLSRILLGFSRLRAIENRAYVVRSTDSGLSAVIDPFGRVVAEVPFGTHGHIVASISPAMPVPAAERLALGGTLALLFGVGWSGSRLLRRWM